jgi:hypothetical protein
MGKLAYRVRFSRLPDALSVGLFMLLFLCVSAIARSAHSIRNLNFPPLKSRSDVLELATSTQALDQSPAHALQLAHRAGAAHCTARDYSRNSRTNSRLWLFAAVRDQTERCRSKTRRTRPDQSKSFNTVRVTSRGSTSVCWSRVRGRTHGRAS